MTIRTEEPVPFPMPEQILRLKGGTNPDNMGRAVDPVEVEPVSILYMPVMADQTARKVKMLEKLVQRLERFKLAVQVKALRLEHLVSRTVHYMPVVAVALGLQVVIPAQLDKVEPEEAVEVEIMITMATLMALMVRRILAVDQEDSVVRK